MSKQTTPKKLDRLIEAGSNPARSTFTLARKQGLCFCNKKTVNKRDQHLDKY